MEGSRNVRVATPLITINRQVTKRSNRDRLIIVVPAALAKEIIKSNLGRKVHTHVASYVRTD